MIRQPGVLPLHLPVYICRLIWSAIQGGIGELTLAGALAERLTATRNVTIFSCWGRNKKSLPILKTNILTIC